MAAALGLGSSLIESTFNSFLGVVLVDEGRTPEYAREAAKVAPGPILPE
jgi:hypothetical protein